MEVKKWINRVVIILLIIVIIVLAILLGRYATLYKDSNEPKFSYYVIKDAQITYADIQNHNAVYENFAIGNYDYDYTLKLIDFIKESNNINLDNEYLYVKVLFENTEYDVGKEDDCNKICEEIKNEKENYIINVNYNEETGLINLITIEKF